MGKRSNDDNDGFWLFVGFIILVFLFLDGWGVQIVVLAVIGTVVWTIWKSLKEL